MSNARELAELGGSYGTGGFVGMKNRLINSDMRIDQRNAGATLSLATTGTALWAVDRFYAYQDKSGVTGTVGQSTQAPSGFVNSFAVLITTGATSATSDQSFIQQSIEGLNVSDLGWGTASAQSITLSFWVRSSITGTNGFSVTNSAANRCYVGSYTVNSANTWEQKTVTIAGDTSGTWLTTNGVGIRLRFNIGSGATYLGTVGSWGGTYYAGPTGAFSTTGTSGATFYITGVQLEKGSTATSFDKQEYGDELRRCQRYYQKIIGGVGTAGTTTTKVFVTFQLPVQMRIAPTGVGQTGVINVTSPGTADYTQSSTGLDFNDATVGAVFIAINNFTGLTAQRSYPIRTNGGSLTLETEL